MVRSDMEPPLTLVSGETEPLVAHEEAPGEWSCCLAATRMRSVDVVVRKGARAYYRRGGSARLTQALSTAISLIASSGGITSCRTPVEEVSPDPRCGW